MKVIYTILFWVIFTLPLFSQDNITLKSDSSRIEINNLDQYKITSELLEKLKELPIVKIKPFLKDMKGIQFIPIPPATQFNSKAELLPRYMPGDIVMKFIDKKE